MARGPGSPAGEGFAAGAAGQGFLQVPSHGARTPGEKTDCRRAELSSQKTAPPRKKGREGEGTEVKCTLHLGNRFLIDPLIRILKSTFKFPSEEKKNLLKVNIKFYY